MGRINQVSSWQDWSQSSLLINIPNSDQSSPASEGQISSQSTICSFQFITSEFIYLLPCILWSTAPQPAPFQITKWYLNNYNHKSSVILPHVIISDLKDPPNQLSAFHKFSKDFYPIYREIFSPGVGPLCGVNKKWQGDIY